MTVDRAASRGDSHQNPFWPASEPFAEQPCDPDRPDDQYSFAQDFQSYSDTHLGAETAVDGWTDTLASTHPSADEAFFWLPDQQWAGSTQDDWSGEADTGERWGAYREWEEPGAASFDPFDPAQEHSELAVDHAAMVRPSWPPLRQLLAFGEGGEAPALAQQSVIPTNDATDDREEPSPWTAPDTDREEPSPWTAPDTADGDGETEALPSAASPGQPPASPASPPARFELHLSEEQGTAPGAPSEKEPPEDLSDLNPVEKFARILEKTAGKLPGKGQQILEQMLDPTTLATSAAIVVGLAAAHTNPLTGAAAEAALWAWTVQQLGEQAQAALEELQAFLDKVGTAQTDQDYEEAAEHLANLLQMGAEVLLDKVLDRARGVGSPPHDAPDALTPGRPSHSPETDTTEPGGSGRPADPGEVAEGSQSLPAGTGIPVDFGAAHQPTVAARLEGDRAADGTGSSQVSAGSASPAEQSADPQHQTRSESGSAPPGGSPPLPPPVGPARRQERLGQLDSQEREALEGQRNWPVDQDLSPERRRALGPEWTGEKEAKVRGFPPAEPGYHWVLDEHGTLRYDRLSTEVGPARQYHQESDRFEQRPEQPPEKRPVREFDGQANPQTVFEHLYRERQSFRQYFEALKRAGLVQDRAEVEALLGAQKGKIAYEGRTDENVRDDLKAHFREALVERMARPGSAPELRQKYADLPWETDLAEAQHQAGVRHLQERYPDLEWQRNPVKAYDQALYQERHRITSEMNPSDKGNLTERWYRAIHGDVAEHHVHFPEEATVRKAKVENGKPVLDANGKPVMEEAKVKLASNRVPDFIEGEAIHEMKAISGPLDKEGKQQFEDNMRLARADGEVLDSSGKAHRIKEVMYTFFEPEGVKANAAWMRGVLKENRNLFFEIYNAKGERKIVTSDNTNELSATHLDAWLDL